MGRKRRQGKLTPQKAHNHMIEDLLDNEVDKSPFDSVRRLIRMFNNLKSEFKENI
jgi:hypothetical protein